MISTLHRPEVIKKTSRRMGVAKKKPKCIIDYNTHMHSVDTADQYLAYYPFIRKTVKWPKKVFFYEGQLISNAHSEISRKRDHVFKQTKVGSKVQYFSYKLIHLFFDSRFVIQYIFPNVKQVYACHQ